MSFSDAKEKSNVSDVENVQPRLFLTKLTQIHSGGIKKVIMAMFEVLRKDYSVSTTFGTNGTCGF